MELSRQMLLLTAENYGSYFLHITYLYDMIFCNTSFKQMLTKDVEEKEGFTTTANAGDNLYHPIAFGRDELI